MLPMASTVLDAIRQVGVYFPTLCYWEGLPPYGACRLCLVEVSQPRPEVIAACAYPAADGMVIDTHGPRALAVRKMMLEFMLARCPTSETIRTLAKEAGVTQSRFPSNPNPGGIVRAVRAVCACVPRCGWRGCHQLRQSRVRSQGRLAFPSAVRCLHRLRRLRSGLPDPSHPHRRRGRHAPAAYLEHHHSTEALSPLWSALRSRSDGFPASASASQRASLRPLPGLSPQGDPGSIGGYPRRRLLGNIAAIQSRSDGDHYPRSSITPEGELPGQVSVLPVPNKGDFYPDRLEILFSLKNPTTLTNPTINPPSQIA